MNPARIIALAEQDGVRLNLSSNGKIKIVGSESNLDKWQSTLQEHKPQIIEILTIANSFEKLYAFLAPKYEWGDLDYEAWRNDFQLDPQLTCKTLRALRNAYQEGRYQNICHKDWVFEEIGGCDK
jgi:hypothetical protein